MLATRSLLQGFADALQSVFAFYCRLGEACASDTDDDKPQQFSELLHPPHATELVEPSKHRWITGATVKSARYLLDLAFLMSVSLSVSVSVSVLLLLPLLLLLLLLKVLLL